MITSRHQNVIQNQNVGIGNLFENVEKFKYLGVTVKNITNDISEEVKRRINMGNALEKFFSSRRPSKKLKINT